MRKENFREKKKKNHTSTFFNHGLDLSLAGVFPGGTNQGPDFGGGDFAIAGSVKNTENIVQILLTGRFSSSSSSRCLIVVEINKKMKEQNEKREQTITVRCECV